MNNNYAIVMAGGVGSRFWPVSTPQSPKQFQDMMGVGHTLIQKTVKRLAKVIPIDNIYVLTNAAYRDSVLEQLPQIPLGRVLEEPVMRNTAPCILYAALKIYNINTSASILVAPSDHWIENEDAFAGDIARCFQYCESHTDMLLTLGIKPLFPSTGYGYIEYKHEDGNPFKHVKRFTEKPPKDMAEAFIKQQNYLWNSGIFIWHVQAILKAFAEHVPVMYALLHSPVYNTEQEAVFIKDTYPKVENISVDYAILEPSANVKVLPASFDWNDLGTWGALYDNLPKDANANVAVNSQPHFVDANGNIIMATSPNKRIVVCGLQDFIVAETPDALLICPKAREQDVKTLSALDDK